jgi:hypothetical protein
MKDESRDESFEIDLNNVTSAVDDNLSYISSGTDTITISSSDLDLNGYSYNYGNMNSITSNISTITLPSTSYSIGSNSNYAFNAGSSGQFLTSGSNGTSWTNSTGTGTVNINTDGIEMAAGTDLKIDGKSLKTFMNKMEERLAILVPDPAKLEKFEALKKAYEHYKTMESLCFDEPKEEN